MNENHLPIARLENAVRLWNFIPGSIHRAGYSERTLLIVVDEDQGGIRRDFHVRIKGLQETVEIILQAVPESRRPSVVTIIVNGCGAYDSRVGHLGVIIPTIAATEAATKEAGKRLASWIKGSFLEGRKGITLNMVVATDHFDGENQLFVYLAADYQTTYLAEMVLWINPIMRTDKEGPADFCSVLNLPFEPWEAVHLDGQRIAIKVNFVYERDAAAVKDAMDDYHQHHEKGLKREPKL